GVGGERGGAPGPGRARASHVGGAVRQAGLEFGREVCPQAPRRRTAASFRGGGGARERPRRGGKEVRSPLPRSRVPGGKGGKVVPANAGALLPSHARRSLGMRRSRLPGEEGDPPRCGGLAFRRALVRASRALHVWCARVRVGALPALRGRVPRGRGGA